MVRSPWGKVQWEKVVIPNGVVWVSTASHGGVKVYAKYLKSIPQKYRRKGGWYEEDCNWAIPYVYLENILRSYGVPEEAFTQAKEFLKRWYPDIYEEYFGVILAPGESYTKDSRVFKQQHKDDYVVVSAINQYVNKQLTGMVIVTARPGGYFNPHGVEKKWLVPEEEYDKRGPFGFVVDPEKYPVYCPKG